MLKKFISAIRQFKVDSFLASAFMACEVGTEVAIPFLMSRLIDNGISAGNMDYVLKTGITLIILACFALLFGSLSGIYAARASGGFAMNLRQDMFYKIQDYSFSNIDRFSSASLVTRLTTDVTNVQNAFQGIIRQAVRSVIMISAALVMVFTIAPKLAWIYLIVMPFLGLSLFLIIKNVHPIFERSFKIYDKLNGVVQENLSAIRVVKSFVREETEKEKFDKISGELYKDFSKAQKIVAFNPALIQLSVYVSMILIFWIGAKLVVSDYMTTGELMSFFTYTIQLLMNLMMMAFVFVMIIIARTSAKRIVEVLSEEPDIKNPAEPLFSVTDGSISFKDAGFSYINDANKQCLSNVNLEIAAGETVGIIGGTGSSKTTMIQLISRLYDVTSGQVCVGGADVRGYDIKTLRDSVAVVLQKNTLFSGSVRENLLWGDAEADDDELRRVCRLAQADGFINAMPEGYDTHIEQGGRNLSGGQKQRLCIARALLKKPKVLILDDSTSAVDTKTDAALRAAFRDNLKGTTKIIIAQRVASVKDADKIIIIEGGRIDAVGTHTELLKGNAIYREVFEAQNQGGGDFDAAG